MKKLMALLLSLLLMFGIVNTAMAEAAVTKVVFWHCMSDEAGALLEQYVADFNATVGAEMGIAVEAVFQGKYSDATTKLNGMISARQTEAMPDVMQMDATGKVAYASSGAAYTVDAAVADHPETDLSTMLPAAMGNWNYAGQQLGLPFATSTTIMYYNKTLLDAAGVTAPETFADIISMAAALPDTNADGVALTAYAAVTNTPTLANWLGQLGSYVVNNNNGSEASATELACVENGALATFLTEWKAMYDAGALANNAGSSDAFVAGQQVLMTGSSSNVTSNLNKIGGAFEMGVAMYPRVNADASCGATVSGSCLVMFDKSEAVKAASWAFVQYMTGAQVQADFAIGTGYIPSNTAALETEAYQALVNENPMYGVGLAQLMETPAEMRSVTVGPSADFYYAIQNCVIEMLDDDLDVDEAVEILTEELTGLLDQYNKANQ